MQDILKLKPIFQERIWGGRALEEYFGYEIPSHTTGECWAISAHRNGDCLIENGELAGQKLSEVYKSHRDLFGRINSPVFPLLTKILDAKNDLSVQVHPDDEYAMQVENDLGKTECWYILDCEEGAELIFGHTARTRKELEEMIQQGNWDSLLTRVSIQPGDFFYVPSGTIHALCKGTLVLAPECTQRYRKKKISPSPTMWTPPSSQWKSGMFMEKQTRSFLDSPWSVSLPEKAP